MDRPLHAVRTGLEDFLAELATLHYRYAAGLALGLPLQALYAEYPEMASPEAYAAAGEAQGRARSKGDLLAVRRLHLLRDFLAGQVEESLAAPAAEAVTRLQAQARLPVDDQTLSFGEALYRLPREPLRARRALLEHAVGQFLWEQRGPYGDRLEAALHTAERLGAKDYPSLCEELFSLPLAPLAEAAEQVLRSTEDAWRELLGYALKKLDPTLKPLPSGGARRHDLQAAARAPWLDSFFLLEDTRHAVLRCLTELGFDPGAARRIRLDEEPRPGKSSRPFVAAVRVPEEVRLVVQHESGLDALGALLHEYGHALHLAHVGEQLPQELRLLGDASVGESFAALFEHLPQEPRWLERYLRLPRSTARDSARLAAFRSLMVLRRLCARLPYELSLLRRGTSTERAEEYADGQRRALFVEPHPGFFLLDLDPRLYSARYLQAWALEVRLTTCMVARFNEDWWRNPAAGRWLQGLFARGGTDDAQALARELSGAELALPEVGRHLVTLLNA